MKLQVAFFETILSLIIVISIASLIFSEYNRQISSLYEEEQVMAGRALAYDLFVQASKNASLYNCIESFYYNNSDCIKNYLELYKSDYKVSGIEVTLGSKQQGSLKNPLVRSCEMLNGNLFCIEVR